MLNTTDDSLAAKRYRQICHEHISRYLKRFDRSQLLVLQYEKCVESPHTELERTFRFLDLEMPDTFTPRMLRRPRNATKPGTKITLSTHMLACLIENYEDDVRTLVSEFPEIDPDMWENFRAAAKRHP